MSSRLGPDACASGDVAAHAEGRSAHPVSHHLRVSAGGDSVCLTVHGVLDAGAGATLVQATAAALASGVGIDIDLSGVTSHTDDGVAALATCWQLDGTAGVVRYHAGTPAARRVLLAACLPHE